MTCLLLLARLRLRLAWRRAVDEAFVLLVLGPIVVLPAWWIAERYLDLARGLAARTVSTAPLATTVIVVLLVASALWPGARAEARGASSITTPLAPQPVDRGALRIVALGAAAVRALVPAAILLAAMGVLAGGSSPASVGATNVGAPSIGPLPLDARTVLGVVGGALVVSWLVALLAFAVEARRPASGSRTPARASAGGGATRGARRAGPVGALLRRDVRQVRRGGPAVAAAGLCVVVALVAAVLTAADASLEPLVRRRFVVLFALLGALAASAVAPFLAARQVPQLWLERSSGAPLTAPARAKALLALGLAAGPVAVGLLVVAGLPDAPELRAAAAGQLVLGATMVASVVGLGIYEIPEQPLLGLLFAALAGSAVAALVLFVPALWWLWTAGWVWLVSTLAERSALRLRMMEVAR